MKSGICVINKSYIADDILMWVDHYLNYCGFDHIFIYDNCTACTDVCSLFSGNSKVTVTRVTDDEIKSKAQVGIFSECLAKARAEQFDYILFADNDELLWMNKTKYSNINEFLEEIQAKNILHYSIPWRFISYDSQARPYDRIRNFRDECQYILNDEERSCTVKSFISPLIESTFLNPHLLVKDENTNFEYYTQFGTDLTPWTAKADFEFDKCDLILYHYYMKSWEEWDIKLNSYRIDLSKAQTYKETYDKNYTDECNRMFGNYTVYLNPFNI